MCQPTHRAAQHRVVYTSVKNLGFLSGNPSHRILAMLSAGNQRNVSVSWTPKASVWQLEIKRICLTAGHQRYLSDSLTPRHLSDSWTQMHLYDSWTPKGIYLTTGHQRHLSDSWTLKASVWQLKTKGIWLTAVHQTHLSDSWKLKGSVWQLDTKCICLTAGN